MAPVGTKTITSPQGDWRTETTQIALRVRRDEIADFRQAANAQGLTFARWARDAMRDNYSRAQN